MGDAVTKSRKQAVSIPGNPVPRQQGEAGQGQPLSEADQRRAKAEARAAARARAVKVRSATERDLSRHELRGHAPRPVPRREIRPRTAEEARAAEQAEIQRLMTNWARWKAGAGLSSPVSQAWTLEAKGMRAGTAMPLTNGEAVDVDAAVDALWAPLREAVNVHWREDMAVATREDQAGGAGRGRRARQRSLGVEQRAKACGCEVRTYYRRLDQAHERILAFLAARRAEAERARETYRSRNATLGG